MYLCNWKSEKATMLNVNIVKIWNTSTCITYAYTDKL